MSKLAKVVSLLQELGAERLAAAGHSEETLWLLGETKLAIRIEPDGAIRVDEVLVSSPSLPTVLDAIANVKAREIRGTERRGTPR